MAQVNFYILKSDTSQERCLFACRLLEKIYRLKQTCYVLTQTDKQSEWLDNLLWTFRAGSFIPHAIYKGESVSTLSPILIGTMPAPHGWHSTVLNLSEQSPQADKVLEIIDAQPSLKMAGRLRYRQYQQMGMELITHNV